MTPRASEQHSGLLVGKSDDESSDHGPLLWLCKVVVFSLLMFIVASVKTTASWVHLRCYSDVILFLFLDQTVPLAILPVVHQDGKCFAYDEIDMFNACKGDTFDLHPPASTTDANDRDPGSAPY